ncbi:unnamed protein product [Adineta ricciae]|uniref:Uncharacterized protein n=1 Tax=Adineta ricciae TaxID=249248 RepID=A0A815VR50_ADIRI|nr:unnamed protein product [Adineta ricciae]
MLKYIFLLHSVLQINGSFRVYNSDISYRDCLYSNTINTEINEWILTRYCLDGNDAVGNQDECDENVKFTFEELKLKHVSGENLFKWNAPIDTINNYEKYLGDNDMSMKNDFFCNCSDLGNFFGKDCSYSFRNTSSDTTFDEIISKQFGKMEQLSFTFEILDDEDLLTCYKGIQCDSTICLDWRQICDGFIDCRNGEDEFKDCLLIELNQCEENEYRCSNGLCIPQTFLIDLSYDCGDITDEEYDIDETVNELVECHKSTMIVCDFSQSRWSLFPCGNGEYNLLDSFDSECANGRHLFYRRNLLLSFPSAHNNNISSECWLLMICVSENFLLEYFDYAKSKCLCNENNREKKKCVKDFNRYCPSLFYFQHDMRFLSPFVKFLYDKSKSNADEWWEPTHICFMNETCVERKTNPDWSNYIFYWQKTFSFSDRPTNDERLFYCNESQRLISKYRVKDSITDCYYGEDENDQITSLIMTSLNLTDRFKCKTGNQWMVRTLIADYDKNSDMAINNENYCRDKSYQLYVGKCRRPSDFACQFLRGTVTPLIYNVFRENCNGINHVDPLADNETDETNCEEWSTKKCNNIWDWNNGTDELNCVDGVPYYLSQTVLKCQHNEHYCADQKGTIGCLAEERAGDGGIDCLGATDERKMICTNDSDRPFQCRSGECLNVRLICNKDRNCPDSDDEIICPISEQCNKIIDCQPDGEDEWFCDLEYRQDLTFSLKYIEEYPLFDINLPKIAMINDAHSNPLTAIKKISKKKKRINNWFCNRGIIIRFRFSNKKCLCPPSYYGLRCQYQSERVLITVKIDIPISLVKYGSKNSSLSILARLILGDKVFDYERILHEPLMKQMFYLNYPRPPPKKQGNWSVRFDAFLISTFNVQEKASWLFNVPFSFLPVNRLVLHLMLEDSRGCQTLNCIHGICRRYLNSPYDEYCQCDDNWSGKFCQDRINCSCVAGGKCIDGYCVCPLARIGNECRVLFNPCHDIKCENGGTCLPLDERQSKKFECMCPNAFWGIYCERRNAEVQIEFSSLTSSELELVNVFVHFLNLESDLSAVLSVENRFLYKNIKLNQILHVYQQNHDYLSAITLIEIYHQKYTSNYYLGALLKKNVTNLRTQIDQGNRCPYVDELIFNETIRKFSLRKKLKYYHYACKGDRGIKCFHDEASLCFCDQNHQPDCVAFPRSLTACSTNYCQNNGQCISNIFNGVWDFACICDGCSYGSLCQLVTSEYVLSFDVILGPDIKTNMPFMEQPFLIKFALAMITFMVVIGTLSNVLSLITFRQGKIREYGCGMYLFCLAFVGQIGLSIFGCRYVYLLITQLYDIHHFRLIHWSCLTLDYTLSVCPILFDWIIVCIAIERYVNVIKGASFEKTKSVWWAKRLVPFLTLIIICSSWHELFVHELIHDPRSTSQNTWCIIKISSLWIKYYRLILNLFHLIIPGSIHLIATILLLNKTTQRKQTLEKTKNGKSYWEYNKSDFFIYIGLYIETMA